MPTIRPATKDDVPTILELIRDLAAYEKLSHEVVATEADLEATLFGDKRHAEVLLAFDDDSPVAFALFFHNYSTFLAKPGLYLEDLYVRETSRSKGIGRALLKRLAEIAHERGCGRMEWWVLGWNRSAIRFYERLGAKAMDAWTVFRMPQDRIAELAAGKSSS